MVRTSPVPGVTVPPERPSRGTVRVLLVDDDPTLRDLGTGMVGRQTGLSASAVATPREALDVLGERPVDAVASDVDMPGALGDGVELYRAVRARWSALPFVFFTGTPAGRLSGRVDLRSDPATGYVRKGPLPERFDALGERIERVVDRNRRRDRAPGAGGTSAARAIERFGR